ncbi:hypothetical protein H0H92_010593 [Tricholoma furcatifolium]|nr:hypothetical protein H0H92_010593 [Tricholoma furcatifolium]
MSFILYTEKTPLHFKRTQNLMDRLIAQSIQSGTITAVAATTQLVFFLTDPEYFLYACVYSNVLLANLNARQSMQSSFAEIHYDSSYGDSAFGLSTDSVRIDTLRRAPNEIMFKSTVASLET